MVSHNTDFIKELSNNNNHENLSDNILMKVEKSIKENQQQLIEDENEEKDNENSQGSENDEIVTSSSGTVGYGLDLI